MTKCQITGHHPYAFRSGEPAEILGVEWCTPDSLPGRACLRVRFNDGEKSLVPLSDVQRLTGIEAYGITPLEHSK